jgi:predicted HTH transcriptional regulator
LSIASDVLKDAAQKAEERLNAIEQELAAQEEAFRKSTSQLRDEADELRDAIARIKGSNARSPRPARQQEGARRRLGREEREAQILEFIQRNPGLNGKQVAEGVGVSSATAGKIITSLRESGRIRVEGKKASTKLFAA